MSQDEHQGDPQYVMPPKEAARRLGVAASTLRRLAPTYEKVHGPLPWEGDEAGGGRMWSGEAVARVQAARALVEEGRAKSLESALRALAGGASPPSGVLSRPSREMPELPPEAEELVQALRTELEAARQERADMQALRREVAELHAQVAVMQALSPTVDPAIIDQALQAELREGQAPPSTSQRPPKKTTRQSVPATVQAPQTAPWCVQRYVRQGGSSSVWGAVAGDKAAPVFPPTVLRTVMELTVSSTAARLECHPGVLPPGIFFTPSRPRSLREVGQDLLVSMAKRRALRGAAPFCCGGVLTVQFPTVLTV